MHTTEPGEGGQNRLLDDPIFRVSTGDGRKSAFSLPEVFAMLSGGAEVTSFDALQAHQEPAWASFLAQVGVLALRFHEGDLPTDAQTWRRLLVQLSASSEEAWQLEVADLSKPAFMQSPVPERTLDKYKPVETADSLDNLQTAKNFDLKSYRIGHPRAEHWVFSLVSMQTHGGFLGRGNYGVSRMNSGFGNRPRVGFSGGADWSLRFRRDLEVMQLVDSQEELSEFGFAARGGVTLLWTLPWDGATSLSLSEVDRWVLEIGRRIRFRDGVCLFAPSLAPRLAAKERAGVLGDPWTPIKTSEAEPSALTIGGAGFNTNLTRSLLFEDGYKAPPAQGFVPSDGETVDFEATALARGQGKTEGFHHRVVPIPTRVASLFHRPDERERLAELARVRFTLAGECRKKVLWPALKALLTAGSDGRPSLDTGRWTRAFDVAVDQGFFEALWTDFELDVYEQERRWQDALFQLAKVQLDDAVQSAPLPSIHRYRAESAARAIFYTCARKQLPAYFEAREEAKA